MFAAGEIFQSMKVATGSTKLIPPTSPCVAENLLHGKSFFIYTYISYIFNVARDLFYLWDGCLLFYEWRKRIERVLKESKSPLRRIFDPNEMNGKKEN
jgi:hypothetical protein